MKKTLALALAALASLVVTTATYAGSTGFLRVHMVPTSNPGRPQGSRADCWIIELPDNTRMVVDIGDNGYYSAVTSRLTALGISQVKYLVGTHDHVDHIGDMNAFVSNGWVNNTTMYFPKGTINTQGPYYSALITALNNKGMSMTKLKAGDYIVNTTYSGKTFKIRCLSPENSKVDGGADDWGSENEASLVLKITYGAKSILMQGDAYGNVEDSILAGPYGSEINLCQVIKAGHHGVNANGAISCREAYLDAAGCNKALISNGDLAIDATIKARLQARNIHYFSTGFGDGYCYLETDGSSNWVESEAPQWP
ncbi:MAG: hypothetical protein JWM68_2855 [Verrucomicrobiales bacterium]|nr:hypothetical protein [Verrucomicrobiales bacterium]